MDTKVTIGPLMFKECRWWLEGDDLWVDAPDKASPRKFATFPGARVMALDLKNLVIVYSPRPGVESVAVLGDSKDMLENLPPEMFKGKAH